MLVVAKAGREDDVREILGRWDLEAETIGEVTGSGNYVIRENGVVIVDIPGAPLVDDCPTYTREGRESEEVIRLRSWDASDTSDARERLDPARALLTLLDSPTIASKRWVYEQYDSTVRTNTVVGPGSDAGVLRLRGTRKAIAVTVDCNGRYVYLNHRMGGRIAVAEAARNLVCSGARPLAVTDNLNFGNPLKPEVYHQLSEAVKGVGEACRTLQTPVTGGNVSLYNENPNGAIYPTPTIGMVGLVEDIDHITRSAFSEPGDTILLLGRNTDEIGGSEYLKVVHGVVAGDAPGLDLEREKGLQTALLEAIQAGLIRSAHDVSEGGLAVALAESAVGAAGGPLGIDVELQDDLAVDAMLFGEAQSRVVVSLSPEQVEQTILHFEEAGIAATPIGRVGERGSRFSIRWSGGGFELPVDQLRGTYENAIPRRMESTVEQA